MSILNEMFAQIDTNHTEVIQWRRMLHQFPEVSHNEHKTSRFIAEQLRSFGIEVTTGVGKWQDGPGAVIGYLRGGHDGPTVALRADMDALPIRDEKTVAYRSQVTGVMHACGHDGHTANLLGVAKTFAAHREHLRGHIKFIFQHAEETYPGGAKMLVDAGVLDDVDVIYGVHLWSQFKTGEIHCAAGEIMATAEEFLIEIQGKGGHAAQPHMSVDALVVGAQLVLNLQTIVSRSIDPIESCVVTVGSLQAGQNFNVIADTCTLKGTVRTFRESTRALAEQRVKAIALHTGSLFGADVRVDYKGGFSSVVNDTHEADRCKQVVQKVFGRGRYKELRPIMAGEDFAFYLEKKPGCFMFVGARNEEKECIHDHHHPKFDFDENALVDAAKLLVSMTLDYFRQEHE